MRFVSPALKHVVFPALSRSGYLRRMASAGPAIVTYHGVFPTGYEIRDGTLDGNLVHADALRRQLRLLKKSYRVITPEEFLHWMEDQLAPLPPRSILLTCDDALQNTLTEMVPLLHEMGLSCLFFATGASAGETLSVLWYEELYLMLLDASEPIALSLGEAGIDFGPVVPQGEHANWWKLVEQLSRFDGVARCNLLGQIREQLKLPATWREKYTRDPVLGSRFLMLDRSGLRELAAAGMTIGAHTLSHPVLARMSDELARREISESRSVLEEALGRTVWALGYPFGNAATVTGRELRLAEEAGFRCAFLNTGGGFGAKMNRFALPRVHVTADMSLAEFEAHVSGFYRSLRQRMGGGDEVDAAGD